MNLKVKYTCPYPPYVSLSNWCITVAASTPLLSDSPHAVALLGARSLTIWLPGVLATRSHQLKVSLLCHLPFGHKWINATFWRKF